jgi:hypothetical protein
MLMKPGPATRSNTLIFSFLTLVLLGINGHGVFAQSVARSESNDRLTAAGASAEAAAIEPSKTIAELAVGHKKPETTEEKLSALEQILERQSRRLDHMQQTIADQQETIRLLATRLNSTVASSPPLTASVDAQPQPAQAPAIEDRLKKVEGRVSEIGAIKFEGDMRLRSESFFGLTNNLSDGNNPAVFGNELSPRHRMRLRARLKMSGAFGEETEWCKEFKCKEFEWALRIATGSFADNISTNQTFTDFFNRKPFALDQAFVSYRPNKFGGHLQLQAGKFEPPWSLKYDFPWSNPEMMIDNDLMVDGFSESYTHTSKTSSLKELKFVAWQLPLLERNSGFVRNSNGTVNIDQSRRDGRDLALYGGQIRARLEPNAKLALHLSVANLYFSGTQFISPLQVFGSQLLLPITVTIPASSGTPAQVITTQVSIPRDLLVAGNGNLGLTTASNNAVNRDGRLSSGFNLVNMLARLDLKYSKNWPVSLIFNFVTNTQAHGVVTAGPGGANLILPNHEKNGFWGEVQIGKAKERGDLAFAYTFMHLEKDAVLTPFNFSDITQQSDSRAHRFQFGYTLLPGEKDARVLFAVTGIITERLNGLFGPFVPTPLGSLNRATTRLQFDTIMRF